jgi:hypothetical protein
MGGTRPLGARNAPFAGFDARSRWPAGLSVRQMVRAAEGLEQIAADSRGRMRAELLDEAAGLRRRAWLLGGPRPGLAEREVPSASELRARLVAD